MTIKLPDLDLQPGAVRSNRDLITAARATYRAALTALEGLQKANEAMCQHPGRKACYDPLYGGGGYSHSRCDDCGASNLP